MRRGTALTFVGDAFMQGSNPRASSLCTAGGAANHFTQKGTAAAFKPCGGGQREPQSGCEFVAVNASSFGPFGNFFGCVRVCVSCLGGVAATLHPYGLFCVACGAERGFPLSHQFKKMTCNEQNRTQ